MLPPFYLHRNLLFRFKIFCQLEDEKKKAKTLPTLSGFVCIAQ